MRIIKISTFFYKKKRLLAMNYKLLESLEFKATCTPRWEFYDTDIRKNATPHAKLGII